MEHYEFASLFKLVYDRAVEKYASGHKSVEDFCSAEDKEFLRANGITVQNLFDYAEDRNNYGEPDFELALAIELVRRDFFLNSQNGVWSSKTIDEAKLPPKAEAIRGIEWLPRLIPKAKAKLRGELPSSLMYCCGGDRRFFKTHRILPSEFLAMVWRNINNDSAIVDWVANRAGQNAAA